ncbi:hypothetical protein MNBD_ALPHA03-1620 [hydrothermal vent metagenome]|uniref:DUF1674 domain-containing protein n=1 Tax=hydrothermal vent metagenome TaxID=652676 RepID=A0A3B1B8S0_9ZZZZ
MILTGALPMSEQKNSKNPMKKPLANEGGADDHTPDKLAPAPKEIGGRKGPEPTRYGDWENKGITSDF